MYYCYLVRCADGTLYCGSTKDTRQRMQQHNAGIGSVYVRTHGGGEMVYTERFATIGDALRREIEVKKWPRKKKENLIKDRSLKSIMKITLCGSIAFIDEMQTTKNKLEGLGHEVKLPPLEIVDNHGKAIPVKEYYAIRKATNTTDGWIWDRKEQAMRNHFDKVTWADSILVLNYDKNNISNYIGANTLLEMGLAFYHGKKIFLFKPIPEISYKEEILGMRPIVINGDLSLII